MQDSISCRQHVVNVLKAYVLKHNYEAPGDSCDIYFDIEVIGPWMDPDDWAIVEKIVAFGMPVHVGHYWQGSSEMPPFAVMVQNREHRNRYSMDAEGR